MAKITCCRDCENRHPACHDHCEVYKAEKEKAWKAKEQELKNELVESTIIQTKTRLWMKMKRGHRR